ncbi:MAG: helix-turn-helix transcriptional regulator [Geobacteraceae bacterium]
MKIPDLNITLTEVMALYLIRGNSGLYQDTEIEKRINSAYAKLDYFVPEGTGKRLESIKCLFISSTKFTKDYKGKEDLIDRLSQAILQRKNCRVNYFSFDDGRQNEFNIDPLHFLEWDGGLYLFVNTTNFGHIRLLAVERIAGLEVTDKVFSYPSGFDPYKLMESSFGLFFDDPVEARIWFSSDQARYIKERKWGSEQRITEKSDGSIILELKTSGRWEIKKWVLSFGSRAELLEPENLRKEIFDELRKSLAFYG